MKKQQNMTILVVEDNSAHAGIIERIVEDEKLPVTLHIAGDGEQALAYLDGSDNPRPNLILMDLNMPRMDGFETIRRIRADERFYLIPVVAFTTSGAEEDIARAYAMGGNLFIQKPDDLQKMMECVMKLIECWTTLVKTPPIKGGGHV